MDSRGHAGRPHDQLLSPPPEAAESVGLLHAQMLLMGDGQLEGGGKSFTGNGDELWGFGRLRMRMWNAAGMDQPWRVRLASWTHSDSEVMSIPLNPQSGTNTNIPSDVDLMKAVVWWYEPNLNYASNDPAELKTQVCNETTSICSPGTNTDPDAHRRTKDDSIVGYRWAIKVTGLDVPANADPDDHYGEQDRSVFLALYWEDRDRDDAGGPDTGIQ